MTTTLREQLENKLVRYRLDRVFVQTIEKPKTTSVQHADGTFGKIEKKGVYLSRAGDGTGSTLSEGFDLNDEDHKAFIDKVDAWIAKYPGKARSHGIEKVGIRRPAARIPNWDNMDIGQVEAVVEAVKPDLLWAMEYELLRPENLGGAREDVLNLLETINRDGFLSSVEESDEVPVL